jgi:two-component system, LytTR family, response regulator
LTYQSLISLATPEGRYLFSPEKTLRLKSISHYTKTLLNHKTKLKSVRVLKDFVQMPKPIGFVHSHRTHLVDRQHMYCATPEGNVPGKDSFVAGANPGMKKGIMKAI